MMDVRKKLVELFYDNNVRCDQKIEGLADDVMDIISHGITVQEWIPVTERLPKNGVRVLALHNDGIIRIGISRGYFPSIVSRTNTKSFGIAEVTHWMPLPEPPKGE